MAKLSTDELLEAFKEMTLIELSEFVKQFEETFEVTAAAPVAVAAAPAAGGAAAAEGPRSRTSSTSSSRPPATRRSRSSRRCAPSRPWASRRPRTSSTAPPRRSWRGQQGRRRQGQGGPRGRRRDRHPQVVPASGTTARPAPPHCLRAGGTASCRPAFCLARRTTSGGSGGPGGEGQGGGGRGGRGGYGGVGGGRCVRSGATRGYGDVWLRCLTPPGRCGHHRTALDPRAERPWDEVRPVRAAYRPLSSGRQCSGSRRCPAEAAGPGSTAARPPGYAAALRCPFPAVSAGHGVIGVRARRSAKPRKGCLLAASRKSVVSTPAPGPRRVSFAKISEPLEVPDLLALQTESLRLACRQPDVEGPRRGRRESGRRMSRPPSGLEEIFEEISPIEDFSDTMPLSFSDHRFEPPKYTIDECNATRFHLRRAALRQGRVHEPPDRRDQDPDGLHGRLPAHDRQGHLHHQRHRACRRVAARPLARASTSSAPRQDLRQGHLRRQDHPEPRCVARVRGRQAGPGRRAHRPQAQAAGHRAPQGPRPDDEPRSSRSFGLRVDEPTLEKDAILTRKRPSRTSTASCARASSRRRGRAALLDNFYFNPKRYDLAKVGRYKINRKLGTALAARHQAPVTIDDIVATIKYLVALHAGVDRRSPAADGGTGARSRPTTSTTSATAASARSASSSRTRSARVCPAWSASCASA